MEIVPEYTPIHTKLEINNFEDYMKIREIIQNYSYIEINRKKNEYWKQSRYIFRGQANSEWSLQPSLECILNLVELPILADVERKNNNFEQTMWSVYKSLVKCCDNKYKETLWTWITRCQHSGGPTRLLDFTNSFENATFFALYGVLLQNSNPQQFASIYLINQSSMLFKTWWDTSMDNPIDEDNNSYDIFNRFLTRTNSPRNDIYILYPDLKKSAEDLSLGVARMVKQKGIFLYPGTLETPFETLLLKGIQHDSPHEISIENLLKCLSENDNKKVRNIIKINISHRIAKKILVFLAEDLNIRYFTLFPIFTVYDHP